MKKMRYLTAALCAVVLLCGFTLPAYAYSDETATEEPTVDEATGGLDWEGLDPDTMKPLTPDGTGTVVDNATDGDGKEFFTIITEDESVFYLVIDRQRNSENVYFLNAVTLADLLSLAERNGDPIILPVEQEPDPEPLPSVEPEPAPEPEPAGNNNMGMPILAVAVIAVGGGAGWYFKIYRPKQQRVSEVEEDYGGEYDLPEDYAEDGVPDWEDGDAD